MEVRRRNATVGLKKKKKKRWLTKKKKKKKKKKRSTKIFGRKMNLEKYFWREREGEEADKF